jgi:UDP-galactopyranose mutase
MAISVDYLIVGAGLTGGTIARLLHEAGGEVMVVDRRAHLGGNVHDHHHQSGIRVHTYGPHYFRTHSQEIWRFVNRFSPFYRYEAVVKTLVDGEYENWPVAASYIRRKVGLGWTPGFAGTPSNFEEASLSMMPALVYDKFVKGYSEKQWGVTAHMLAASLARRFDVRQDDDPRLVSHRFQGLPVDGYAGFARNLFDGIPVLLNVDYLRQRASFQARKCLIFTGPIDEFFNFDLGRLAYRGQERHHQYLPEVNYALPCAQVNNPDSTTGVHIRSMEWKRMMPPEYARHIRGTVVTNEVTVSPTNPDQFEYPFPDDRNARLYADYRARAAKLSNVVICGRLGEYRYYDMDQAIERATTLSHSILGTTNAQLTGLKLAA